MPSTEGEPIESFALRVAEARTLGRTGIDDGALLVVAVKDRQLRIEVGYGLEGALIDATSNRIIDEWIVPPFKTGDIHTGVIAGVEQILRVIEGEALPSPRPTPSQYWDAVWIAFCMAFLFVALLSGRGRPHPLRVSLAAVASGAMTFVLTTFALTAGISAFAAVVIASWLGGSTGRRRRVSPRRDHDSFSGDRIEGRDGGGDGDGDEGGSFGGGGASGRW